MKIRIISALLLLVSLLISVLVLRGISSPNRTPFVSPLSIYQGDLVVSGNENYTIIDQIFSINGSIIVEENATLILNNAIVNFTQARDFQHAMRFASLSEDNPFLQASDVLITSNYRFTIWFFYNSSASISNCTITEKGRLTTWYSSYLYAVELKAEYLEAYMSSTMYLVNSDLGTLMNSGPVTVWLVNSTYDHISYYESQSEPKAYVCWFLDVHVVDSIGQHVPSANVTVYYHTGAMTDSKLTNTDGLANFIVTDKVINPLWSIHYGNYTIKATYGSFSNQRTVNMTENKQVVIVLEDFVIPEFPTALILPLFMIFTLIVVLMKRKKENL